MVDAEPSLTMLAMQIASANTASQKCRHSSLMEKPDMGERMQWFWTALRMNALMPIAVAGLVLIAGVAATAPSQAQTATINVAIQPAVTALPMVVADKKGLFAKRNIAVKWRVSQVPISDTINTLGRQFDITMGTQPALIAAAGSGVPVVAITGGGLIPLRFRPAISSRALTAASPRSSSSPARPLDR